MGDYDEIGPGAEARRLRRQAEMESYVDDRREEIRREERIRRAEQGGGYAPAGGCLSLVCLMALWGVGFALFGLSPADFRGRAAR